MNLASKPEFRRHERMHSITWSVEALKTSRQIPRHTRTADGFENESSYTDCRHVENEEMPCIPGIPDADTGIHRPDTACEHLMLLCVLRKDFLGSSRDDEEAAAS